MVRLSNESNCGTPTARDEALAEYPCLCDVALGPLLNMPERAGCTVLPVMSRTQT